MNNLNNKEYNVELLSDPKFYLENFTKIKNKEGKGLVPFILKEAQKDLFNTLKKNSRIMIIKARQIGFSTSITGWIYHKTITTSGVTSALIGYNNDLTAELLDKIKTFYRTTPDALKPTIHYNTKFEISFPKVDSKILVLPSTENVGRGYTINFLLLTELPFIEKAEEKMMTIEASVPVNGKIIIESCVTGDTFITTEKGLVRMRNVVNWKNYPMGIFKSNLIKLDTHEVPVKTNIYHKNGVRNGYRITTVSGNSIGMSNVHPLLIMRNGFLSMIKAEDMNIGDYVATKIGSDMWGSNDDVSDFIPKEYGFNKQNIELFNPKKITKDLAYLMGLVLGDGYIYKNKHINVTNMDKDVEDFLLSKPLGLNFIKTQKQGKASEFRCTNQSLVDFFRYIDFKEGVKAPKKEIPDRVLSMSKNNVIAFLQGLFDSDGSSSKESGIVKLTSTSKQIIDVTKILLLNLGIVTSIHNKVSKPTKKVKAWSFGYNLVTYNWSAIAFYEKVGFRIKRKQINFNKIPIKKRGMVIPGIGQRLYKIIKGHKKLGVRGVFSRKSLYSKHGGITYWSLKSIIDFLPVFEGKETLEKLYESNYFFDKIVKKEKINEEVYDFTVPKYHTFIANGIVSSNSPGAVGDVFHRMWVSDNDYVKKEYGWWWNYTLEEVEIIRRRMNNPRKFANNYSLEFLTSGRSVFDAETLRKQRKNILKVGDVVKLHDGTEHIVYEDNGFRIYKPPRRDGVYVLGNDNAEGVAGGDYSVITIFDRSNGEEVGFWRGHTPPDKLAKILNRWGRHYNNALAVVECEAHGNVVLNCLKQLLYPSIYFRPSKFDTLSNPWSEKMGWKTTKLTRPLLVDDFEQAVRDGLLTIHSKEIIDEMTVFAFDSNNNMRALDGYHDDAIFSAGLAYQGFKVLMATTPTQLQYWQHLPPAGY